MASVPNFVYPLHPTNANNKSYMRYLSYQQLVSILANTSSISVPKHHSNRCIFSGMPIPTRPGQYIFLYLGKTPILGFQTPSEAHYLGHLSPTRQPCFRNLLQHFQNPHMSGLQTILFSASTHTGTSYRKSPNSLNQSKLLCSYNHQDSVTQA